jgi:hypothetical protein
MFGTSDKCINEIDTMLLTPPDVTTTWQLLIALSITSSSASTESLTIPRSRVRRERLKSVMINMM